MYTELGRAFAFVSESFSIEQITAFLFLLGSMKHQVLMGCLTNIPGTSY